MLLWLVPYRLTRGGVRLLRAILRGRLRVGDVGTVLEAFADLALVRVGIRLFPARVFRSVFDPPAHIRAVDVSGLAALFAAVARNFPLALNCLHRSLALQRMLRRRGARAELRIGIGRRPDFLPGHAWVEVDGRVINDHAEIVSRYEPLQIGETALTISYAR